MHSSMLIIPPSIHPSPHNSAHSNNANEPAHQHTRAAPDCCAYTPVFTASYPTLNKPGMASILPFESLEQLNLCPPTLCGRMIQGMLGPAWEHIKV